MESGYDDIEFITSVTKEELVEIGIVKKGSEYPYYFIIYLFIYYFIYLLFICCQVILKGSREE